jgi:hypothetical protein
MLHICCSYPQTALLSKFLNHTHTYTHLSMYFYSLHPQTFYCILFYLILFFFVFLVVLGIEPRALHMLGVRFRLEVPQKGS